MIKKEYAFINYFITQPRQYFLAILAIFRAETSNSKDDNTSMNVQWAVPITGEGTQQQE
jgi:hypothetical protein